MSASVMWFRRDLRLSDNPALNAAAEDGPVTGLFVLDPALRGPSGDARLAFLAGCLRALHDDLGGRLVVRLGRPEDVVPAVAQEAGANAVHIAADYGPYGSARDARVEAALADVPLIRTGSPYAVAPGRVRRGDGGSYRVFTPFERAWREHGWREPAPAVEVEWARLASAGIPDDTAPSGVDLPEPGEAAAAAVAARWLDAGVDAYGKTRNVPGVAGTSRLSAYLKYGCIHPRTILAGLGLSAGAAVFRKELAWRDFYADVMHREPDSIHEELDRKMRRLPYDTGAAADERLAAWQEGRTGYPIVDAGMRQLQREAWMHNRVRMIVGSFLVKDLHLDWRGGAKHFMHHLVDGDLASNYGGWQWVAGTGTDAAPFFRIFNPVLQSQRVDPDGDYIRRYVPELAEVSADLIHEPWRLPAGPPAGYPLPIVDHAEERAESLRRYGSLR